MPSFDGAALAKDAILGKMGADHRPLQRCPDHLQRLGDGLTALAITPTLKFDICKVVET